MRRILLIGKNGQVGWELQRTLAPLGELVAVDRRRMDLADPDAIRTVIRETQPQLIVNAAAYTAVDKAEVEPELAMAINGIAPGIMAEEAKRLGAIMVHYSTDYVFDGQKTLPYTEENAANPLNAYGRSKLAGELAIQAVDAAHLILRTSWVYGLRGRNFLLTILRLAKEREELKIVDDQIGAPTWSRMIAEATGQILAQRQVDLVAAGGIYHLSAAGRTSWHGFAREILENRPAFIVRGSPRLIPITTSEYPLPAVRPLFSALSVEKLGRVFGIALPSWDVSLAHCLDESRLCASMTD